MKQITIKLDTIEGEKISRSQAREVLRGSDTFERVIIDFDYVFVVGQAFADEIYRVFQNTHPGIEIKEENMSDGVRFMVERAKSEAKIKR